MLLASGQTTGPYPETHPQLCAKNNAPITGISCVMNAAPIIAELDELEGLLLQCRSVFPTLGKDLVGHREFLTAPYYVARGHSAQIRLPKPITKDFIKRNGRLGKWINENAIIRLYGIMKYYGFLKEIDQALPGSREVDLMRRMRNAFTKTPLSYRPEDPDNLRLRETVIEHFNLRAADFPGGEIPTPINGVLEPIFKRCRDYVRTKCADDSQKMNQK